MLERFRKKSSPKNETTEDVAATLTELEVAVEAEVVASGDEIEQARQDLMRAAMEAIMIPAAEAESEAATSVRQKSDDTDIPVIRVNVTRSAPSIPAPKPQPPAPTKVAEPSTGIEPEEFPPAPVEPAIVEQKAPESDEMETATDESPEIVPLGTDPLVVKHEPPETKETTGSETQQIEEQEDVPEEEFIAPIVPGNELLSSRLMVSADVETVGVPVENPPAEIMSESPASDMPSTPVSLSVSTGEPSDEPRIAQLDDIMIDIVRQDIASHRQRISRPS